jgi:hypothetical protein
MERLIQRLILTPNILEIMALVKFMYPTQQHSHPLLLSPLSFIGNGGLSMNLWPYVALSSFLDAEKTFLVREAENSGIAANLLGESKSTLPVGQPPFKLRLFNG